MLNESVSITDKIIKWLFIAIVFVGIGYAWHYNSASSNLYKSGLKTGELSIIYYMETCLRDGNTAWFGDMEIDGWSLRCVPRDDGRVTIQVMK